jgi:hypothetical protein
MYRKGQRVRFYDERGRQVGPEQSNVAPAVAYAQSQGWRSLNPHKNPERKVVTLYEARMKYGISLYEMRALVGTVEERRTKVEIIVHDDGSAHLVRIVSDPFDNPERKVIAISKDRYRASAEERRRYGGNTVTEFYVMYKDDERDASKWKKIFGYGKTPGERKTYAIEKFRAMQAQGNPSRLIPPPGFGQWAKGLFGNGQGVEIHVVRRGAGNYAAKVRKDGKWIAEGHGATQQEALDAVARQLKNTNPQSARPQRVSRIQSLAQRLVNGG